MIAAPPPEPSQADLPYLEQRCHQETRRYRDSLSSDGRYCLEIFRRALARAVGAGEEAAELLVRLYSEYIRAQLSRQASRAISPDDLVQQVWLRFWSAASRGLDFPSLGQALAYLRQATCTAVIEAQRGRYAEQRQASLSLLVEDHPRLQSADPFTEHARRRFLERCLELLDDPLERRVFWMRYGFGLRPQEIAARLAAEGRVVGRRQASPRAVSDLLERLLGRLSADEEIADLLRSD